MNKYSLPHLLFVSRIFIVTTMPPCAQQHRERRGGRGLTFSVRACARLPPHLPTSSYAYDWGTSGKHR